MSALGVVLSLQWADAVPGTPGWLFSVNVAHVALTLAAALLVGRAASLSRA